MDRMLRLDRHKLHFGPYRTPMRVVIGTYLPCAIRSGVKVVGMSKASIPWPIGARDGEQELVVYRGLLRALQSEEEPEPIATTTVNHRTSRIVKRNMTVAPKVNGRD